MKVCSLFFAFAALLLISGCARRGPKNPQEAAGEYVFGYRQTKEIEVVILKPDLTFTQQFYKNLESYHLNAKSEYTNTGNWEINKNQLVFQRFMVFCEDGNPEKKLPSPTLFGMYSMSWYAPNADHNAWLAASTAYQYGFIRVTNRSEVQE